MRITTNFQQPSPTRNWSKSTYLITISVALVTIGLLAAFRSGALKSIHRGWYGLAAGGVILGVHTVYHFKNSGQTVFRSGHDAPKIPREKLSEKKPLTEDEIKGKASEDKKNDFISFVAVLGILKKEKVNDFIWPEKNTRMHIACEHFVQFNALAIEAIDILLEKGASLDSRTNKAGKTPREVAQEKLAECPDQERALLERVDLFMERDG